MFLLGYPGSGHPQHHWMMGPRHSWTYNNIPWRSLLQTYGTETGVEPEWSGHPHNTMCLGPAPLKFEDDVQFIYLNRMTTSSKNTCGGAVLVDIWKVLILMVSVVLQGYQIDCHMNPKKSPQKWWYMTVQENQDDILRSLWTLRRLDTSQFGYRLGLLLMLLFLSFFAWDSIYEWALGNGPG